MHKSVLRGILLCIAIAMSLPHRPAFANQTIIIDDFEDELPAGFYDFEGANSQVAADTQVITPSDPLARLGQLGDNGVLSIDYDISSFGGVAREFRAGPQDWSEWVSIRFWMYGTGSTSTIQLEIFDNRSNPQEDTSERYEYRVADDFEGWKEFVVPFTDFRRATDFQPEDAPEDGFTLSEIWGYSFVLPPGRGSLYIDEIALNDFIYVADYESGPPSIFFGFKDENSVLTTQIATLNINDPKARPGQHASNQVLEVAYGIEEFGGVTHSFEAAPQDWSTFAAFSFWFYGSGSNARFQIEILDNRGDPAKATEERFEFVFNDSFQGWQQLIIPFEDFVRSTDFQPAGAPDDGFNRTEIWGYSFTLPTGSAGNVLFDQIAVSRSVDVPAASDKQIFSGSFSGVLFGFKDEMSALDTAIIEIDTDSVIALPRQEEVREVLQVDFSIGEEKSSFGGFTNLFPAAQDWRGLIAVEFWFYGAATNEFFQLEILNNRAEPTEETSERFQYRFVDYLQGWRKITVPFSQFERAKDFQPEGAPNDGLNLQEMWGFSLTFPQAQGSIYLGDVNIVRQVVLIDFEAELPEGWFTFPRASDAVTNAILAADGGGPVLHPGQEDTDHILEVTYAVEEFGGVAHVFDPTPRNWFGYTGILFWFYGNNSGKRFQFEIRENRSDRESDTSEYFEYLFVDNFIGWRQFQIPFDQFQRAADFQPEGAPNDGFSRTEIWGYSFTFPIASGKVYIDDIMLYGLRSWPGRTLVYLPLFMD